MAPPDLKGGALARNLNTLSHISPGRDALRRGRALVTGVGHVAEFARERGLTFACWYGKKRTQSGRTYSGLFLGAVPGVLLVSWKLRPWTVFASHVVWVCEGSYPLEFEPRRRTFWDS